MKILKKYNKINKIITLMVIALIVFSNFSQLTVLANTASITVDNLSNAEAQPLSPTEEPIPGEVATGANQTGIAGNSATTTNGSDSTVIETGSAVFVIDEANELNTNEVGLVNSASSSPSKPLDNSQKDSSNSTSSTSTEYLEASTTPDFMESSNINDSTTASSSFGFTEDLSVATGSADNTQIGNASSTNLLGLTGSSSVEVSTSTGSDVEPLFSESDNSSLEAASSSGIQQGEAGSTTKDFILPQNSSSGQGNKNEQSTAQILADPPLASSTKSILDDLSTSSEDAIKKVENSNEAKLENGLDGSGDTGANSVGESDGNTLILTGDVHGESSLENIVNTNLVDLECNDCDASSTSTEDHQGKFQIKDSNISSTTNQVNLDGNTGKNTASGTKEDSYISTGDVEVFNSIMNYINTNIIGKGKEYIVNIFSHLVGNIDLSGFSEGEDNIDENSLCEIIDCEFDFENYSTSTLINDIEINANSGENVIGSTSGKAIIETGDVAVFNDVMNLENLNISGDDWLFAVVNIYGMLEGDVVLPSYYSADKDTELIKFLNDFEAKGTVENPLFVKNKNDSELSNKIEINANTGNNIISSSSETSIVQTGNVETKLNVLNLVNLNFVGDKWRFTKINLFGNWDGVIEGLPDGYDYVVDEEGITVFSDDFQENINKAYLDYSVKNYNFASTTNNIVINANTGDNAILHNSSEAVVSTGDILVENNLFNFINNNFVGDAWEYSMVNVFGDWQGNLSYGKPDLWINETIEAPSPARKGDMVKYNFIFGNKGDAVAKNVVIQDDYDENSFAINSSGVTHDGDKLSWDIGDIAPNSQGSISYLSQVNFGLTPGRHNAENTVSIMSGGGDRDPNNNISGGSVEVDGGRVSSSYKAAANSGGGGTPGLAIVKTNDAQGELKPGDVVNFKIIVKNMSHLEISEVLLSDVMTDEDDVVINSDLWNLETVLGREEIIIEYAMEITKKMKSGVYSNTAIVEGADPVSAGFVNAVASTKINVNNSSFGNDDNKKPLPNIVIGKISRSSFVNPGDRVEQEIIITNNGKASAYGIAVSEKLADEFIFTSGDENTKTWEIGELKEGEFKNLKYSFIVREGTKPGTYTNETSLSGENVMLKVAMSKIPVREIAVLSSEHSEDDNSGSSSIEETQFVKNSGKVEDKNIDAGQLFMDSSENGIDGQKNILPLQSLDNSENQKLSKSKFLLFLLFWMIILLLLLLLVDYLWGRTIGEERSV